MKTLKSWVCYLGVASLLIVISGCSATIAKVDIPPGIDNLLPNPKLIGAPDQIPEGWRAANAYTVLGQTLFFTQDPDDPEGWIVVIDDKDNNSYVYTHTPVPVKVGVEYEATVEARTDVGRPYLYLDYLNENGSRVEAKAKGTSSTEWELLTVSFVAPPGSVTARILLYSESSTVGKGYFRNMRFVEVDKD